MPSSVQLSDEPLTVLGGIRRQPPQRVAPMRDLRKELTNLTLPGVYWPKVRDHVVNELTSAIASPGKTGSRLARALRAFSTYVELKPGLFGLSIKLNPMLALKLGKLQNGQAASSAGRQCRRLPRPCSASEACAARPSSLLWAISARIERAPGVPKRTSPGIRKWSTASVSAMICVI